MKNINGLAVSLTLAVSLILLITIEKLNTDGISVLGIIALIVQILWFFVAIIQIKK